MKRNSTEIGLMVAACVCLGSILAYGAGPDTRRFEFDNDIISGGSDDQFSAGWSMQWHSSPEDSWDDLDLSAFSKWVARSVPGLEMAESSVRRGKGIGQYMQTPEDISQEELIEDDVPYAGILTWANSWYAGSDDRAVTFQMVVGVMGPLSLAEDAQKFVHNDLGAGDDPRGWDNQLDNEPLFNLNYHYSHKLARFGRREGVMSDISAGGGVGLGNIFTYGQAGLEFRVGWHLPRGFTEVPDVAGRGVIVDPCPDRLRDNEKQIYFTAVVRGAGVGYAASLDGNAWEDSHSVDYDRFQGQGILGLHFARAPYTLHLSYMMSTSLAEIESDSDPSWGNISLDWEF
jgi:lipid A 3-O-deacylase